MSRTNTEERHPSGSCSAEIEVHLKEYEALRAEIREYVQRVDRYAVIYLAGLFGVIGFFLRPGGLKEFNSFLETLRQEHSAMVLILFIPILNSFLQIHLLSCLHAILALAKYSTYTLGGNLSKICGREVLVWDKYKKGPFLAIRETAGSLYNAGVFLISLTILWINSTSLLMRNGYVVFMLLVVGALMVSLAIAFSVESIYVAKRFHDASVEYPREKKIFYCALGLALISLLFSILIIGLCQS